MWVSSEGNKINRKNFHLRQWIRMDGCKWQRCRPNSEKMKISPLSPTKNCLTLFHDLLEVKINRIFAIFSHHIFVWYWINSFFFCFHAVDGWNPAPSWDVWNPVILGSFAYQLLQDFFPSTVPQLLPFQQILWPPIHQDLPSTSRKLEVLADMEGFDVQDLRL